MSALLDRNNIMTINLLKAHSSLYASELYISGGPIVVHSLARLFVHGGLISKKPC